MYAVIGNPISHSLSPVIHNSFFDRKGLNSIYVPLKIEETDLAQGLLMLRTNFQGFNVTIPHKEAIIPYLDEVHEIARRYGAVNTVQVVDGKLIGYNTDGFGFLKSLRDVEINVQEKKVLLLGAGGSARVVAYEILQAGGILTIAIRNPMKGIQLKEELEAGTGCSVNLMKLEDVTEAFDCVINSTPVGMYPEIEVSPISQEILEGAELVYDLIYNPYQTKLLHMAEQQGCKAINGLPMLVYQALKSLEIWTGEKLSVEEEKALYKEVETYFLNSIR